MENDKLKWEAFKKNFDRFIDYGAENKLIKPYDKELIDNLGNVYYGGLPASILLLHSSFSNGYCYDRATLVTLGFGEDDFQIVYADIDHLKLRPDYISKFREGKLSNHYAEHCFAERTTKDGRVWVYDTSLGLVFDKDLYYQMENPVIRKVNSKEDTLQFLCDDFQKNSNNNPNKYRLRFLLPILERDLSPTQPFYKRILEGELVKVKQIIANDSVEKGESKVIKNKGFER